MYKLKWRGLRWLWSLCLLIPMMQAGCGCYELEYALSATAGEITFLTSAVPIEQALYDPALTDEQRDNLELVILARDYAEQVVGLNIGTGYRTFVNLHGEPLAWNLSASRKDAIAAYYWNIPFVGWIPYLGYFEFEDAIAQRDWLVSQGYDTLIYEIEAFSTLGLLPDPITSALISHHPSRFVDTIMHELLHNTIWSGWETIFDESLAVFVGRTASMEFLISQFGADDSVVQYTRETREDTDKFNTFINELRAELDEIYESDMTSEEKIAARQPIFEAARQRLTDELLPTMNHPENYEAYTTLTFNNAFMLVNQRYHTDFELFESVYELAGRDWTTALDLFQQAANSEDPFTFLRNLLEESEN